MTIPEVDFNLGYRFQIVQLGAEKASGRLYSGLPLVKEGLPEKWGGVVYQELQ